MDVYISSAVAESMVSAYHKMLESGIPNSWGILAAGRGYGDSGNRAVALCLLGLLPETGAPR
jgi:hypothetical protein